MVIDDVQGDRSAMEAQNGSSHYKYLVLVSPYMGDHDAMVVM
jgi:hypothetical protein